MKQQNLGKRDYRLNKETCTYRRRRRIKHSGVTLLSTGHDLTRWYGSVVRHTLWRSQELVCSHEGDVTPPTVIFSRTLCTDCDLVLPILQTDLVSCSYIRPFTGDVVKTGFSLSTAFPMAPVLLLFLRGFASPSMVMTSLMDGLSFGSLAVQRSAIRRTKSISSWTCLQFPTIGSSVSSRDLFSRIILRIHSTMSPDSANLGSNGCLPVISSIRTTP